MCDMQTAGHKTEIGLFHQQVKGFVLPTDIEQTDLFDTSRKHQLLAAKRMDEYRPCHTPFASQPYAYGDIGSGQGDKAALVRAYGQGQLSPGAPVFLFGVRSKILSTTYERYQNVALQGDDKMFHVYC